MLIASEMYLILHVRSTGTAAVAQDIKSGSEENPSIKPWVLLLQLHYDVPNFNGDFYLLLVHLVHCGEQLLDRFLLSDK